MNLELLCRRGLEALLNGGYQGLLLAGAVWVVLCVMRRASAATRHNICLAALLLVALLPAAHFARSTSMFGLLLDSVADRTIARTQQPNEAVAKQGGTMILTEEAIARIEPQPVLLFAGTTLPETAALVSPQPLVAENLGVRVEIEPDVASKTPKAAILLSNTQALVVILVIAAIALIRLSALARQLWLLRTMKQKAEKAPDALQKQFGLLCAEMRLTRSVALLVADHDGPCAVGYWKPCVIVPRQTSDRGDENMEAILRHELAHIARGDDWASLVQQVVHALFFFHPAVWLLARRLTIEREIACDDQVLVARPDRRNYALLLADFAHQLRTSRFRTARAVLGGKTELKRRISMILNEKRNASPQCSRRSVGMISAVAMLGALLAVSFAPQVAVAQSTDESGPLNEPFASDEVAAPRAAVPATIAPRPMRPAPGGPAQKARLAFAGGPVAPTPVLSFVGADLEAPAKPAAPAKPSAPASAGGEDSVESRLERLERMLEGLVAKGKGGRGGYAEEGGYGGGGGFVWSDPGSTAKMQAEMQRASKEAARVAKEFNKNFQNVQRSWKFDQGSGVYFDSSKPLKAQRKMLEAQRKVLEKQLEALNEQLASLEKQEEAADEVKEDGKEKSAAEADESDDDTAGAEKRGR
jgi:beta-lactamase regulating signal transducer with metallopeptidase domain